MRGWLAAGFAALMLAPIGAQAQKPEMTKVQLGVGGKTSLYYLPLTVTEKLGYFKEAGLDVEISDFAGGARSLQALMGGSVRCRDRLVRPHDPDPGERRAHRRAGADGPFPRLRAGAAQGEGRRLQGPEGPEGHEDRRHGAGLLDALHGALHDGAGRPEAGGRLVHRHRLGQHRARRREARRSRRDLERRSDDQHSRPRGLDQDRCRYAHAGRHAAGVWRAISGRDALHHGGFRGEESEHRAGAGDRAGARPEVGSAATRRKRSPR